MKNLVLAIAFLFTAVVSAQDINNPTIEKKGDLFEATYHYEDGTIAQQGFFTKDNKLQGTWTKYDINGNKLAVGEYNKGVKVGKWLFWSADTLREVDYANNAIVNVNEWNNKKSIATRD